MLKLQLEHTLFRNQLIFSSFWSLLICSVVRQSFSWVATSSHLPWKSSLWKFFWVTYFQIDCSINSCNFLSSVLKTFLCSSIKLFQKLISQLSVEISCDLQQKGSSSIMLSSPPAVVSRRGPFSRPCPQKSALLLSSQKEYPSQLESSFNRLYIVGLSKQLLYKFLNRNSQILLNELTVILFLRQCTFLLTVVVLNYRSGLSVLELQQYQI